MFSVNVATLINLFHSFCMDISRDIPILRWPYRLYGSPPKDVVTATYFERTSWPTTRPSSFPRRVVTKYVLIAQKKGPDALNAVQKPQLFTMSSFWKNKEKSKKIFLAVLVENRHFYEVFLDFFRNRNLLRAGGFCVALCNRTLPLRYQKQLLDNFSYFH